MKKTINKIISGVLLAGLMVPLFTGITAGVTVNGEETDENMYLPVYYDSSYSFEERAADLVSRMTLEEKIAQLITGSSNDSSDGAAAIPRLGVAGYNWWQEGLHGVARSGEATSFQTGLGIASTWDPGLVRRLGGITGDEARAYYLKTLDAGGRVQGLNYWSPTVNLSRDPRWGRGDETYGEDPYLTGQIGAAYVEGMQGTDENTGYLKTIATMKHFMANNSENNRHNGSSDFDLRTQNEYYALPYKNIISQVRVDGDEVGAVMPAYNAVNQTAMAMNSLLNNDLLRKTWGFKGFLVTDCQAIKDLMLKSEGGNSYGRDLMTGAEATAAGLLGGSDLNCRSEYKAYAMQAIEEGLMEENDIDRSLIRLFTARMKTGEFDPDEDVIYKDRDKYGWDAQISSEEHTLLAEQGAYEAVTLLKNEAVNGKKLLPIEASSVKNIVLCGRNDLVNDVILGGYSGSPAKENLTTPYDGLIEEAKRLNPNINIDYVPFSTGASNLMKLKRIELQDANGKVIKSLTAPTAKVTNRCSINGEFIDSIALSGAYAGFDVSDVDTSKIAQVKIVAVGGKGKDTKITFSNSDPTQESIFGCKITRADLESNDYASITKEFTTNADDMQILYVRFEDASDTSEDEMLSTENVKRIKNADIVIAYVGTTTKDSNEGKDRSNIIMPQNQNEKVKELLGLNRNTVVYMQAVGQMDVEDIKDFVPAMLWCTYNGQAQGKAFARLLFGTENPSGRLPFTWYSNIDQLDHIYTYDIRSSEDSNGRTYQYFKGDVTYPFGYGLSYSDFTYSGITVDKTQVTPNDTVNVTVSVTNNGSMAGKEVVEVYVKSPNAGSDNRPAKRLMGFEKVEIGAGETKTITIPLNVSEWNFWNDSTGSRDYDQGTYTIEVGRSCDDIKGTQDVNLSGTLMKKVSVVTVEPDDYIVEDGTYTDVQSNLTAAYNDDSMAETKDLDIRYTSSNKNVAYVGRDGKVMCLGKGVTTITANVTYNGVTTSGSYPLVVLDYDKSVVKVVPTEEPEPTKAPTDAPNRVQTPVPSVTIQMPQKVTDTSVKKEIFTVKNIVYKVVSDTAKTVSVKKSTKKTLTSVRIPAVVKYNGQKYKVTQIADKAFMKNTKLKKVTIGKYVVSIGKKAFAGDKNLKKITIKSSKLKAIKKQAFKGIYKNVKIDVPDKAFIIKKYKKLFGRSGVSKSASIK